MKRAPNRSGLRLTVTGRVGTACIPFLRRRLPAAHRLLRSALTELSIALVGDRQMSELHERYMRISGPTDVLTFCLESDTRGRATSGEIIICVPEARRRCRESGVHLRNELLLYALHGMLHLSGFDGRTTGGFKRMHRMEDRILTRLGIGSVFKVATRR